MDFFAHVSYPVHCNTFFNMDCSFLFIAHLKGKGDSGPPQKKKKCKKKHLKKKASDEKTQTPKSQQKSSPSIQKAQKVPGTVNGSKNQHMNGFATQAPKGKNKYI